MPPTTHPGSTSSADTPGRRWVDRYFVPRVRENMGGRSLAGVRILQLEPGDADEAVRCRELGAHVTFARVQKSAERAEDFPIIRIAPDGSIPAPDASFDILLTGRLGYVALEVPDARRFLAECARVCAPGGGMLASASTGCPASLAGASCDRARRDSVITIAVIEKAFGPVRLLPVNGHFGWRAGGGARRVIGRALDLYWRTVASPGVPVIYRSPLNPLMIFWARRA